jgi:hypothetical protein
LPTQDRQALDDEIEADDSCGAPPDDWVSDQVDLPPIMKGFKSVKLILEGVNAWGIVKP